MISHQESGFGGVRFNPITNEFSNHDGGKVTVCQTDGFRRTSGGITYDDPRVEGQTCNWNVQRKIAAGGYCKGEDGSRGIRGQSGGVKKLDKLDACLAIVSYQ